MTPTKDIVVADSLYVEKIIFLPSLGHHSMDIIVGVNMGGLGQRTEDASVGLAVVLRGVSHSANEREIWHVTSFTGQGRAKYPSVMV